MPFSIKSTPQDNVEAPSNVSDNFGGNNLVVQPSREGEHNLLPGTAASDGSTAVISRDPGATKTKPRCLDAASDTIKAPPGPRHRPTAVSNVKDSRSVLRSSRFQKSDEISWFWRLFYWLCSWTLQVSRFLRHRVGRPVRFKPSDNLRAPRAAVGCMFHDLRKVDNFCGQPSILRKSGRYYQCHPLHDRSARPSKSILVKPTIGASFACLVRRQFAPWWVERSFNTRGHLKPSDHMSPEDESRAKRHHWREILAQAGHHNRAHRHERSSAELMRGLHATPQRVPKPHIGSVFLEWMARKIRKSSKNSVRFDPLFLRPGRHFRSLRQPRSWKTWLRVQREPDYFPGPGKAVRVEVRNPPLDAASINRETAPTPNLNPAVQIRPRQTFLPSRPRFVLSPAFPNQFLATCMRTLKTNLVPRVVLPTPDLNLAVQIRPRLRPSQMALRLIQSIAFPSQSLAAWVRTLKTSLVQTVAATPNLNLAVQTWPRRTLLRLSQISP